MCKSGLFQTYPGGDRRGKGNQTQRSEYVFQAAAITIISSGESITPLKLHNRAFTTDMSWPAWPRGHVNVLHRALMLQALRTRAPFESSRSNHICKIANQDTSQKGMYGPTALAITFHSTLCTREHFHITTAAKPEEKALWKHVETTQTYPFPKPYLVLCVLSANTTDNNLTFVFKKVLIAVSKGIPISVSYLAGQHTGNFRLTAEGFIQHLLLRRRKDDSRFRAQQANCAISTIKYLPAPCI